MELDILEKRILKVIFETSIFDYATVEKIYSETKSFDDTIKVLKILDATGKAFRLVLNEYKKSKLPKPKFPSGGIINSGGENNEIIINRKPNFNLEKIKTNYNLPDIKIESLIKKNNE